jgi:hypothetical protein
MLILGVIATHSSPFNITWATQFSEQFREGTLYPRWLPQSFGGLGSPTFYFYPPLAFWIDAILSVFTLNLLSVEYRLALVFLLTLFASGIAMQKWLIVEGAKPGYSTAGAIAYVIAPYHFLDIYIRGALAESVTYAVLPCLFLAIRLTVERRTLGPVLLSAVYAALLMTHLPTALLTSVTLLPAYVFFRAWRLGQFRLAIDFLTRALFAGLVGCGLAAVYLLPALTLQGAIAADVWAAPYFSPGKWLVLAPESWIEPPPHGLMRMITAITLCATLVALGLALALPAAESVSRRWEVAFWSTVTLVMLALLSGFISAAWEIPVIAAVQFPWRFLVLVEFAIITGLCIALPLRLAEQSAFGRLALALATAAWIAAAVALAPGLRLMVAQATTHIEFTVDNASLPQYEAAEYVPRGYDEVRAANTQGIPARDPTPAMSMPLITCKPVAAVCTARDGQTGVLSVVIESAVPTTVTLRRFWFPGWRIGPELKTGATRELKLVSFFMAPGRLSARLERTMLPVEKWGAAISIIALCLWAGAAAVLVWCSSRDRWFSNTRVAR